MFHWVSGLIIIFFLIPFITQFRYFIILRSSSYLYFSLLFFLAIVDELIDIINSLFPATSGLFMELLVSMNFHLLLILIIVISDEVLNNKLKPSRRFWIGLSLVSLLITAILKFYYFEVGSEPIYIYLRLLNTEIYRLLTGLIAIHAFHHMSLIVKNNRTHRIRLLWIVVGVILVTSAIIKLLVLGYHLYLVNTNFERIVTTHQRIGGVGTGLIGLITFYLSVKYPETMLISQYQINKATHLYDLVDVGNQAKVQKSIPELDSIDSLMDYIDMIQSELRKN